MAPWERYQRQAPAAQPATAAPGPWERYRAPQPAPTAVVPPAAPPADRSWLDAIMGYGAPVMSTVDQFGRGLAEGVTNIAGLPNAVQQTGLSVLDAALERIGAPEPVRAVPEAFGDIMEYIFPSAATMQSGLDSANNATADALGVSRPDTTPDNAVETVINRVGEELGAAAIPAAGIANRARALRAAHGNRAPQVAREGGRLSRMFLEPAVVNPGRFAAAETTMATGAGLGAGLANVYMPENEVADFAGAVGGAGLTSLGAGLAGSIGNAAGALFNRQNYVDDVVRDTVADRLASAAGIPPGPGGAIDTTDLAELIMSGPRVSDTIPGVQESLADRTRSPRLAAAEYSMQSDPRTSGAFAQRRAQNATAIDNAISALEPGGNPAALRGELANERDRRLMDAGVTAQNASEAAEEAVAPLRPASTPAARGNTIRSALDDAREAARARTSEAYEQVGMDANAIRPDQLIDAIDNAAGALPQAEQSMLPTSVIDRIRGLGQDPALLNEATSLRTLLQDERTAAAAAGQRVAARALENIENAVDNFISANLTPEQRPALEQARAARFDEGERFDRRGDPVNRALQRYQGGQPRMRDENVARSFVNPQNMDRLLAEADTPEVRAAIRDELLSGADTGRADRIEQFVAANQEQLSRFPGLRDELTRAATARTAEAEAVGARGRMERELGTDERRGTSAVGRYLSFSNANVDRAMREVMASRDPAAAADELLTFVGDAPQAVQGARQAFWNTMSQSARRAGETTANIDGLQPWMPAALKRFLDEPRNAAVAERFYKDDPEHLQNLRSIADALQGLDVRNAAKVPNTSGTAQSVLPSAETLGSLGLAQQRGQIGIPFIAIRLGSVIARRAVLRAREEGVQRMLADVMLDPDAAAVLMRENNPANRAALGRWAKLWFGNEASKVMNALSEDDGDETGTAVMEAE